jgi:hypothetical protein
MRSNDGSTNRAEPCKPSPTLSWKACGTATQCAGVASRMANCEIVSAPASGKFGSSSHLASTIGSSARSTPPGRSSPFSMHSGKPLIPTTPPPARKHKDGGTSLSKTPPEPRTVISSRSAALSPALDNPEFRAAYMTQHLRGFLADQIRSLRGTMSQAAFGRLIGKPQSVVSRLEDEDYGKLGLQTLLDIATRLDIAVVVRFVDYPNFLRMTSDFSDDAAAPRSYPETRGEIGEMSHSAASSPTASVKNEMASGRTNRPAGDTPRHRPSRPKRMRA